MFNIKNVIKNSLKETSEKLKANNVTFSQKMEANQKNSEIRKEEQTKEWNGIKSDFHEAVNDAKVAHKQNVENLKKNLSSAN